MNDDRDHRPPAGPPAASRDAGTAVWSPVPLPASAPPAPPAPEDAARPGDAATEIHQFHRGGERPHAEATEIFATPPAPLPDRRGMPTPSAGYRTPTGGESRRPGAARLEMGEVLAGRFRILGFIGRGGMGDVYEAEDLELGERVALKTVRPEVAHLRGAVDRFRREIHVARKVTHANVCRIFDIFRHRFAAASSSSSVAATAPSDSEGDGEIIFFTMELLAGGTLEQRLREGGRMTAPDALPIVRQMAAGLDAAHQAGVIHRDFKPANVMLVPPAAAGGSGAGSVAGSATAWAGQPGTTPPPRSGDTPSGLPAAVWGVSAASAASASSGGSAWRAVITDFGLARTFDEGEGLTVRGDILGTPSYMAPEQVSGSEITAAADIYALGCVLYEMVTGAPPFVGTNSFSTAFKRLQEDPRPPRQHVPDLDPAWDAAILRCLERAPADRFAHAGAVVAALSGGERLGPVPSRRRRTQRRTLAAAAIASLLVVIAVAGVVVWKRVYSPAGGVAGANGGAAATRGGDAPLSDWLHGPDQLYADGVAALAKLDAARAQSLFEKTLAARHDDWLARSGLAVALAELGHEQRATQEAQQAFDHAASLPREAQLEVTARHWQVSGQWDKAAASFAELHRLVPGNLDYALGLARTESGAGHGKDALALLAALQAQPATPAASGATPGTPATPGNVARVARIAIVEAEVARGLADFPRQTEAAQRALRQAEQDGDDLLTARALLLEALALSKRGDNPGALAAFKRAETIYAGAGDQRNLAQVLGGTAIVLYYQGDLAKAKEKAQEALDSLKELGDVRGQSRQLDLLAAIEATQGNNAAAEKRYSEALASYRRLGDRSHEAQALGNLGLLASNQGRPAVAEQRSQEALAIYRQLQDREGEARQLLSLAQARLALLDPVKADAYIEEALSTTTAIDAQSLRADVLVTKGAVAFARGNVEVARRSYGDALTTCRGLGDKHSVATVQLQLANLELDENHPSPAAAYARNALAEFGSEHAGGDEAEAGAALAEALAAQHSLSEARTAIGEAEKQAGKDVPPQIKVELALARAKVAAPSRGADAVRILEGALAEAQHAGPAAFVFDLRLALGEAQMRHGDRKRGAEILTTLESEARSRGLLRVAGKAAEARASGGGAD